MVQLRSDFPIGEARRDHLGDHDPAALVTRLYWVFAGQFGEHC
jgi:hypothetical protein